jgi:hypothetical protein
MDVWRTQVRCYQSPAGNNKIADWYWGLSVQQKADTDEFLKNMRKMREWKPPEYRPRLRDGDGLGELRWRSENKEHRLMGFFMKGIWYAVLGCTHKQQIYDPTDSLATAKRRKKQIEQGEVRTVEYNL